jgi:hypothetical protein
MEFKCWKKAKDEKKDIRFDKHGSPEVLYIFNWHSRKLWYVEGNRIDSQARDFKSKSSAFKFANKYMKGHDKC